MESQVNNQELTPQLANVQVGLRKNIFIKEAQENAQIAINSWQVDRESKESVSIYQKTYPSWDLKSDVADAEKPQSKNLPSKIHNE